MLDRNTVGKAGQIRDLSYQRSRSGFPTATGRLQEDMAKPFHLALASRRAALAAILGLAIADPGTTRARAQAPLPVFEISAVDIARIRDLGGRLHIALRPPARARLARFTAAHRDQLAQVTAGGVVLVEAVVRAEIDSGLISTDPLDDATRGRAFRLLIGG